MMFTDITFFIVKTRENCQQPTWQNVEFINVATGAM
jgi:hypothetical protein